MKRCSATVLGVLLTTLAFSQNIKLINSGEVLDSAAAHHDSGDYQKSIEWLEKIPERDTNFLLMKTRLAMSYQGNKEFDKAIATCDLVLAKPSIYSKQAMRTKGLALSRKGEYEKGVGLLEGELQKYPVDPSLMFTLALVHSENKAYEKAVNGFFKILSMYPYHPSAHYQLGKLAREMGHTTHAMLSYGMYFSVNPSDNSTLVNFNEYLDNTVVTSPIPAVGTNNAEKLDKIVRAKIAMEKNFKSDLPINAAVVRQFELLFDQLGTITKDPNDLWVRYYLPLYSLVKERDMKVPFLYHILSSSKSDDVKKWRNKNEKATNAFYAEMNGMLGKARAEQTVPELGITSKTMAWYGDNNGLQAIGTFTNEIRQGKWFFFNEHYNVSAEGMFNEKGVKVGTWKYYHPEGPVRSVENYETGEINLFTLEGVKRENFFLKNDKTEGEVKLWSKDGTLKEKINYVNDERHGKGEAFFASGKLYQSYNYDKGQLSGPAVVYFENGKVSERMSYKAGKLDGKYESFHMNGKPASTGSYSLGQSVGEWKVFYRNGQLERTGKYTEAGNPIGEWVYYDHDGALTEKRNFNAEGQYQGDTYNYYDGKLHYKMTYKKDLVTGLEFFDAAGKSIAKYGNSDGTFAAKYHFLTGQVQNEGNYRKGVIDGTWKTYNRFGKVLSVLEYKAGKIASKVGYYPTGEKRENITYRDGKFDGYYTEYFRNGKIDTEGWYKDGEQQQQWLSYYDNGNASYDSYYVDGVVHGKQVSYNDDGSPGKTTTYEYNYVVDVVYHSKGESEIVRRKEGDVHVFETLYSNKKVKNTERILNGVMAKDWIRYYPDGGISFKYEYLHGKRNGKYTYFDPMGTKRADGDFEDNVRQGKWTFTNFFGKVTSTGKYFDGNADSVWNYYYPDGRIKIITRNKADERHGLTTYFSVDGAPVIELQYDDGVILAYRDVASNPNAEFIPFSGTGKITAKFPNGVVAWEDEYKDGLRSGVFRTRQSNGKVISEYPHENGMNEGAYFEYYDNGKIYERGVYKQDEQNGLVEVFNEDGSPARTETYVDGKLHGKSVYFKNGVKHKEINYWYGYIEN